MIAVPESVTFYWSDPVNRAALHVMGGGTEVPADLSMAEAERFELAALAARRVRVEHWTLLRTLWTATWGEATRAHLPAARLLDYGGHRAFAASKAEPFADPSVAFAWDNAGHCGVLAVPDRGHLFAGLWLIHEASEVQLQFYLLDARESCGLSDGLDLGADWGEDGSGRRETRAGLLPFARTGARIDPTPFATVAHGALSALAKALT